jgi:DnaK suppressor protein
MITSSDAKKTLDSQLAELLGRRERLSADLAEPLSADFAEQATEREDDQSLEQQEALIDREIANVKAALGRIEDGSYGSCTRCGSKIGEKRLTAMPEAALCIDCARDVE